MNGASYIWYGFMVSAISAIPMLIAGMGARYLEGSVQRRLRPFAAGVCWGCGYGVDNRAGDRCPECGRTAEEWAPWFRRCEAFHRNGVVFFLVACAVGALCGFVLIERYYFLTGPLWGATAGAVVGLAATLLAVFNAPGRTPGSVVWASVIGWGFAWAAGVSGGAVLVCLLMVGKGFVTP